MDEVQAAFQNGSCTCRRLVDAYVKEIELLDHAGPMLNAITIISPLALEEADFLDAHYKLRGLFVRPLRGVLVIVKDQCDTKGILTA